MPYRIAEADHISFCGVPQGSVLGPLLFIMYTTPQHSHLSLSLNRQLYADDTQLFLILVSLTQVSPTSRAL